MIDNNLIYTALGCNCYCGLICHYLNKKYGVYNDNQFLGKGKFFYYNRKDEDTDPLKMLIIFLSKYINDEMFDNIDISINKTKENCFDFKINDYFYFRSHNLDYVDKNYIFNYELLKNRINYIFKTKKYNFVYNSEKNDLEEDYYILYNKLLQIFNNNINLYIITENKDLKSKNDNIKICYKTCDIIWNDLTYFKSDLYTYNNLNKVFNFNFPKKHFLL